MLLLLLAGAGGRGARGGAGGDGDGDRGREWWRVEGGFKCVPPRPVGKVVVAASVDNWGGPGSSYPSSYFCSGASGIYTGGGAPRAPGINNSGSAEAGIKIFCKIN